MVERGGSFVRAVYALRCGILECDGNRDGAVQCGGWAFAELVSSFDKSPLAFLFEEVELEVTLRHCVVVMQEARRPV